MSSDGESAKSFQSREKVSGPQVLTKEALIRMMDDAAAAQQQSSGSDRTQTARGLGARGGSIRKAAASEKKRRSDIRHRIDILRSFHPDTSRIRNMIEVLDDTIALIYKLVETSTSTLTALKALQAQPQPPQSPLVAQVQRVASHSDQSQLLSPQAQSSPTLTLPSDMISAAATLLAQQESAKQVKAVLLAGLQKTLSSVSASSAATDHSQTTVQAANNEALNQILQQTGCQILPSTPRKLF